MIRTWWKGTLMIGLVFNGEVHYITRIDDFRDFMEPEVFDALIKALDSGITSEHDSDYKELKQDYDNLLAEYEELEYECDTLRDDAEENEEKADEMEQKYEDLHHSIEELVNQLHWGYVPQEGVIPTLEKLV